MSYTQNIIHQAECNYINPMLSNAREMLNSCINNPGHNPAHCPSSRSGNAFQSPQPARTRSPPCRCEDAAAGRWDRPGGSRCWRSS